MWHLTSISLKTAHLVQNQQRDSFLLWEYRLHYLGYPLTKHKQQQNMNSSFITHSCFLQQTWSLAGYISLDSTMRLVTASKLCTGLNKNKQIRSSQKKSKTTISPEHHKHESARKSRQRNQTHTALSCSNHQASKTTRRRKHKPQRLLNKKCPRVWNELVVYRPEQLQQLHLSDQGLWVAEKQKSSNKPVVTASEFCLINQY